MKHWYVVHTKPRQEALAVENLQRQAFVAYLPKIRQVRRRHGKNVNIVEPLFPRYLFVQLDLSSDNSAPIRSTRGVSRLVGFGGSPVPVPEHFIDALKHSADPGSGLHRPGEEMFVEGREVTILEGPLAGLKAIFKAHSGEERCIILLNILGNIQRLTIDKDHLWPARSA